MIQSQIPFASYEAFLKGWAAAWPFIVLDIPPGIRVLDIGSGDKPYYAQHFADLGHEAHVLETPYERGTMKESWGVTDETIRDHPQIKFHLGLAGQNIPPAQYFDLITCISVVEHIYDSTSPLEPGNEFPHFRALEDMIRMLAPGGVLVLTYDFDVGDYHADVSAGRGWDYLADIEFMRLRGIPLLSYDRKLRGQAYIYNYEDALYTTAEGVLSFSDRYRRIANIGMIYQRPGPNLKVTYSPHPAFVADIIDADSIDMDKVARKGYTEMAQRLQAAEQELTAMRRSLRWRLAETVTRPLRKLPFYPRRRL